MKKLYTCRDCGQIITGPDEIAERTCDACLERWFDDAIAQLATAAIGVPSRALRATGATS